jgi:hypothetical protein
MWWVCSLVKAMMVGVSKDAHALAIFRHKLQKNISDLLIIALRQVE